MVEVDSPFLSVVVPVYNEAAGLRVFHDSLLKVLVDLKQTYEIVYVDDGSSDGTSKLLHELARNNTNIKIVRFSRNFGKEIAITAGLHTARGAAVMMLDADGQYPVELIPTFVAKWQAGAKVVVGVRSDKRRANLRKRTGSKLFHGMFRRLTGIHLIPGAIDFRLIDRSVQAEFVRLTERNRITRGLIDWLGYSPVYVHYDEKPRLHGEPSYSTRKLIKLAVDSAISLSISPLYITAYLGAVVLPLSSLLGVGMLANYLLGDPLHLHATGGAYLMVLILFLLGILLVSQGIIGLYLSHIHTETQNRPLYIIDKEQSKGIAWNE